MPPSNNARTTSVLLVEPIDSFVALLISGGEYIFCLCISGAALVQDFHLGSSHVSHGGLHAGGPLGRDHYMRPGRHAVVLDPRSA